MTTACSVRKRREYWEARLESTETSGVPSLAAEVGGKVIGFILGSASGWEYGIPENIAWIDTLGVTKEYQKKGVARILIKEMFSMFKKVGVDMIYVFVNWKDWDLLQFFDRMGFKRGDMINLRVKNLSTRTLRWEMPAVFYKGGLTYGFDGRGELKTIKDERSRCSSGNRLRIAG
ncbi:MAG: GNAT family N-acetyltransferase [Desulfomicrobium escambiense]|nr:GNAT family N-acetyltransferase [Desulfomicrobium escambiense]